MKVDQIKPDWHCTGGVRRIEYLKPAICPYCKKEYRYLVDEMQYKYRNLVFCGYICRQKYKREHPIPLENIGGKYIKLTDDDVINYIRSEENTCGGKIAVLKRLVDTYKRADIELTDDEIVKLYHKTSKELIRLTSEKIKIIKGKK